MCSADAGRSSLAFPRRFDSSRLREAKGIHVLDMVPFTVQTIDLGPGRRLMAMRGDLDITAADTAWQHADEALRPGAVLTMDVSRLGLFDSSGLRLLLLARREAEARGATLRLLNPRPWLRERLRLGGVLHLFDVRYSVSSTS